MTIEEQIIEAEARRYDATVRADARALRDSLDEQLLYVHSNGVVEDRETFIEKIASGERAYFAFRPGARRFLALGEQVACVGPLEVDGRSAEKGQVTVRVVCTAVYRRHDDGWKMVLWHACAAGA